MQLQPVPEFGHGAVVSASADLNVLSANQQYAYDLRNAVNFGFERIHRTEDRRYCLHRYRYLYWNTDSTNSNHLWINGHDVGTPASGATSGYIDLAHGQGYEGGANTYGLTMYRPYEILWEPGDPLVRRMYEHRSNSSAFALPVSTPSFSNGAVASATQMNQLADNTEFLVFHGALMPRAGFTARRYQLYGVGGATRERELIYQFKHRCRYLNIKANWNPNSALEDECDFVVKYNGTTIFYDEIDGNTSHDYNLTLDLGGGTWNSSRSGRGTFINNQTISIGTDYTLMIWAHNPSFWGGSTAEVAIHALMETTWYSGV